MSDEPTQDITDRDDVVLRENRFGKQKVRVRTAIGTQVVETPRRLLNPVTGQMEDLTKMSADGYKRRLLALRSASDSASVVDLNSSPVATFDKETWEVTETDDHIVVTKSDADVDVEGTIESESEPEDENDD